MKTPVHDSAPSRQELMEFIDGTLPAERSRELEQRIASSRSLQSEVRLLQALQRAVKEDVPFRLSSAFTESVLQRTAPARTDSLWIRLSENSSNLFAMVLVLSMIGIVIVSGPGKKQNDSNIFTTTMESYSALFDNIGQQVSGWTKQAAAPMHQVSATPSGKFLFIGLTAFFLFIIVDEIIGKRYFLARLKR
jgi:hypothetical protein